MSKDKTKTVTTNHERHPHHNEGHLIDGELFQATEHKFTFSAGNLKAGEFKPTAFLEQLVQFCADTIISTRVIYVKA